MLIEVISHRAFLLPMQTRIPFKFGITTMTHTPHLFLQMDVLVDGILVKGIAADHLPPKWFTKNPNTTPAEDVPEMLRVIRHAADVATLIPAAESFYAFWRDLYDQHSDWSKQQGIPPLLSGFGTSLVERAVIDAICTARQQPFGILLRQDAFGFSAGNELQIDLRLLPAKPLGQLIARHTVGLSDPLSVTDIAKTDRVLDGLPQSLDECIAFYGLTHFKIKLSGNITGDRARLIALAAMLEQLSPHFRYTLDGNENFEHVEPFIELWQALVAEPKLAHFLSRLIFVEQPIRRDHAISDAVKKSLHHWPNHPPIIIDESDAEFSSFPDAAACGYNGTSHKNCKGIVKGITNACRIARYRVEQPHKQWLYSGEDLSNVAPVALLQDIAMMANLGIEHIERNGQHYFKGLSNLPPTVQQTILQSHGDLFRMQAEFPSMHIQQGRIDVASCIKAPFGRGFAFDPSPFASAW